MDISQIVKFDFQKLCQKLVCIFCLSKIAKISAPICLKKYFVVFFACKEKMISKEIIQHVFSNVQHFAVGFDKLNLSQGIYKLYAGQPSKRVGIPCYLSHVVFFACKEKMISKEIFQQMDKLLII